MNPLDHPLLIFVISFLVLAFAAWFGAMVRKRRQRTGDVREYGIVESATLTLLALIVGFTFSMAIDRFGQRKQCEAVEANTIGTEYLRISLLPAGETAKLQALMQNYLDQRIAFYKIQDPQQLQHIDAATTRLQADMWATVSSAAVPPNPVVALAVSGMNEAIDAQGYTQASWWNRIPAEAWGLMMVIALFSNFLLGYTSRAFEHEAAALLVMPLILSISFFLIADIDSPRWGLIHVNAQNLESLAASLHASVVKP